MRNERQHDLDIAILAALPPSAEFPLPEKTLRIYASRCVAEPPTTAELDDAIRYADTSRRMVGLPTETGVKWALTDAGRLWLAQNR